MTKIFRRDQTLRDKLSEKKQMESDPAYNEWLDQMNEQQHQAQEDESQQQE